MIFKIVVFLLLFLLLLFEWTPGRLATTTWKLVGIQTKNKEKAPVTAAHRMWCQRQEAAAVFSLCVFAVTVCEWAISRSCLLSFHDVHTKLTGFLWYSITLIPRKISDMIFLRKLWSLFAFDLWENFMDVYCGWMSEMMKSSGSVSHDYEEVIFFLSRSIFASTSDL